MNVFHKVTLQSLRKNRTRTAVTVIGVILSAAMICAVTTFASSLQNYAVKEQIDTDGNWHGRVLGGDYQTYETVRDSGETEAVVYFQQLGYAAAEGCINQWKPYIYLLGSGGKADEFLPIHLTSGRLPTASDEILLPEHLLTNGGIRCGIGDQLTLSLGQRVLEGHVLTQLSACYEIRDGETVSNGETLQIRETRTYTVTGFYERLNWRFETSVAPGYTAFTVADANPSSDYSYDVYFRMKHPDDVYSFMAQNGLEDETNRDLLMFSGAFRFDTFHTMLYSLVVIVIGLIMFGSIALIYNAFSISVSERTRQFGLLSSVGATKKQLRRMVLFEAFVVSLIGIPLGILSGIGGIGVTLLFIGEKFRSLGSGHVGMTLSVSMLSVVAAAAVALITVLISAWIPSIRATKVSAVEAIRQNVDIAAKGKPIKTSRLTYALFGLPGVLAQKHYKRSRKKYRATVLSLFTSIVLFVSASAFTEYLTETVSGGFQSVGYDLLYQADREDFDKITPEALRNKIEEAQSVTGVSYERSRYGSDVEIRSEYLTEEGVSYLKTNQGQDADDTALNLELLISFLDDDSFRALLQEQGLSEKQFMDSEHPLALAIDGITSFNVNTQRFETVEFFSQDEFEMDFRTYKEIPEYSLYNIDRDEDGNRVYLYIKDGTEYEDGQLIRLTEEEAIAHTPLQIGKVITEKPDSLLETSHQCLIYPLSAYSQVFTDTDSDGTYSYYFEISSDNHTESSRTIKSVLNENGLSSDDLYDIAEQVESDRNTVTIVRVFAYGFIVLISLIAAANVFNTISTNISLRRREFAMLKSVGMTGKGFNRMMNYECILYGSRALLYGLPVSCAVTFLIYRAVMSGYETAFHLPWAAIGISVLGVFLVVFATMLYAMSKIKKENLIDALKNENI